MKSWQCSVCRYIHKGDTPPEKCPVCGVDAGRFVEIDQASIPQKKPSPGKQDKQASTSGPDIKTHLQPKDISVFKTLELLLVKHHAHPVSVHTPNGILPMAVILYILAWIFDYDLLAKAAMISQIFVIFSLPFVIYTGTLEWRKKYSAAMTKIFKFKIVAASLTASICVITLAWFLIDPELLSSPKAGVFIMLNILMLACAGAAGHIGGKLVFKD